MYMYMQIKPVIILQMASQPVAQLFSTWVVSSLFFSTLTLVFIQSFCDCLGPTSVTVAHEAYCYGAASVYLYGSYL